MQQLIPVSLTVIILLATVEPSAAQKNSAQLESEGYKRYAVKSGIIEYTLTGAQSGKEIMRFDRWGLREANETETEVKAAGRTFPSKTESLMDGEYTYAIDRKNNTATRTHNTILSEVAATHNTRDLEEVGERVMKASGAKKTGTATLLGKKCDVWEMRSLGTTMWVYHGVPLKSLTRLSGMEIIREATRFEETARVPEAQLTVPPTMKVTEGGNPLEMLNKIKKKGKE